jgi:hypothetical protein
MSCVYFESEYDIGVCNASADIHIPGVDEMSCHCLKDDYRACSIFQRSLAGMNLQWRDAENSLLIH